MDSFQYKGYRQEAERIYAMDARIRELEKLEPRVLELERIIAALTRNSSNSSRPPSSDLPGANKTKHTRPGNHKQGGQFGHKGKKREILPPEEMDQTHDIFPEHCESCHLPFSSALLIPSSQPARHQFFELPVVVPIKEEYRCHSLLCQCGHRTAANALTLNIDETGWKSKGDRRYLWTGDRHYLYILACLSRFRLFPRATMVGHRPHPRQDEAVLQSLSAE